MANKKRKGNSSRNGKPRELASFRQRLFGGKYNYRAVFHNLQAFGDHREFSAVAHMVSKADDMFHRYVFGIPFSKTYATARTREYFAFTHDLERELLWLSLSLVRYAKEISQFVEKTFDFHRVFLKGDYEKAHQILDSITEDFGVSLWTLEKRLLMAETFSGLEANKQALSGIVSDEANNIVLKLIADTVSVRCESKISVENYKMKVLRVLDQLSDATPLRDYFRYRLDNIGMDLAKVAPNVAFSEGPSPIADRYMTFLAICQSCVLEGGEYAEIVARVIRRIDGRVRDPRVDSLLQFCNPSRDLKWDAFASEMTEVLDLYTNGEYVRSASRAAALLVKRPDVFELYHIYISSSWYLGPEFEPIFPQDSTAARILDYMNIVIRGEEPWRTSIEGIYKIALTLWRDPIAYGLYQYYMQETQPLLNRRFGCMALLNDTTITPYFANLYENPSNAKEFLDKVAVYATGSTLSLQRGLTTAIHYADEIVLPPSIPEPHRRLYSALLHKGAARPLLAINQLKPLELKIATGGEPNAYLIQDQVIACLFHCYLETERFAECTELIVQTFMRCQRLILKLPLMKLVVAIDRVSPPDVMRNIAYPILYSLVHPKARSIYVAFDNFLSSLGCIKPTDLLGRANEYQSAAFHLFLRRVCTLEVLSCSYHFTGTKALEAERILICQYLAENDRSNMKAYTEEISAITSRSFVREGMRQINVSKIFVDEAGIRTSGRTLLEESFTRYRELASLSSIDKLRLLDTQSIHIYLRDENGDIVKRSFSIEELANADVKIVYNSQFLLFKELFFDIRDRFISSNEYGLDAYLSVRIRHGVLQNQIRSPFETQHLLSEKDTQSGVYLPNAYWDGRLETLSEEVRKSIQGYLAIFSRQVDDTALKLNRETVQVKTERKNPNGSFDYTFTDGDLFGLFEREFSHVSDFDQFLDGIFRILWKRTADNLARIRDAISKKHKESLYSSITQLDREIRQCIETRQAPDLLRSIAACQTSLQYELEGVAQWFTISSSSLVSEFSVNDLLRVCIQSINNIYPHKNVGPPILLANDVILNGDYFSPFSDIVRTLIDNSVVHSGLSPDNMGIEIAAGIECSRLSLTIKNCLAADVRDRDPVGILQSTHNSLRDYDIGTIIAREGGSGLLKVRKILLVDLKRKDSSLQFAYGDRGKFVVTLSMELEGLLK
jgi:hypothetical protein